MLRQERLQEKVNSEVVARFLGSNPAILSQFFGVGTHAFLNQFLRLWPDSREKALPYISIPTVLLAGWGFRIGIDSIRNPNHDISNDFSKRISMAVMEGAGFVFPFLLGEFIQSYCGDEKNCMVSDETFWTKFFLPTLLLSLPYTIWGSISPILKDRWLDTSKIKKACVIGADLVSRTLFFSRIGQALMLDIEPTSRPKVYEYVAVPVAALVLVAQIFKHRYRQVLNTTMMYLMLSSLMFYFISFLRAGFSQSSSQRQQTKPPLWDLFFMLLSLPALFAGGLVCSAWYFKQYLKERKPVSTVVSEKFLYPVQYETKAAVLAILNDPKQQAVAIDVILSSPAVQQQIKEKMSQNPAENIEKTLPRTYSEAMKHPIYGKVIKQAMIDRGYEFTDESDGGDSELETVEGDPKWTREDASPSISSPFSVNDEELGEPSQIRNAENPKPFTPLLSSQLRKDSYYGSVHENEPNHVHPQRRARSLSPTARK